LFLAQPTRCNSNCLLRYVARYTFQHTVAGMGQFGCKHMPERKAFDIFLYSCLEHTKFAQDPVNETVPWFPITPDPAPPVTQQVTINFTTNSTGNSLWTMNGVSFRGDYNSPILLLAKTGNDSYPYDPDVNKSSSPPFLLALTLSSGTSTTSAPTPPSASSSTTRR
jgi:hypothetical protein